MDSTNVSERRWVWELLQNAKDVGFENKSVSVEINFDKANAYLEFKHNGKPFSVDNITFLIEQVSTKERKVKEGEKSKTTGKFGTGFLTTHLLSEKVRLAGVVKEPELPHRKFNIQLDRSGREIQEITDSVNASIAILESLDSYPSHLTWNPQEFNTVFRYDLDSKGIEVAEIGLTDLHNALPFTLAFMPTIASISIPHETTTYNVENIESINEGMQIIRIQKKGLSITNNIEIVRLDSEDVSVAIEIERKEGKVFILQLDKSMPRIFCDFPLIGTEDFHFPVVVNSSLFNPNEPRNGIYLTDKWEQKILDNKKLMQVAVRLYYTLLDFAAENNWQNMFHLASVRLPSEKNWISKPWFESEILNPIREKLLGSMIVDTVNQGRTAFDIDEDSCVDFPSHSSKEIREKIWDLCSQCSYFIMPSKEHIHDWYPLVWDKKFKLTLESLTEWVANEENILQLSENFSESGVDVIEWLNEYYDLLNHDEKFISELANDRFAIIPNQNGVFKKKSELFIDDEIEEELKNVLSILGQNWHDLLIHKSVRTGEVLLYFKKTQDSAIDEINKILEENKNNQSSKAVSHLISLFANDENFPFQRGLIYNYSKEILKDEIPEKKTISKWSNKIWKECDDTRIKRLVKTISQLSSIEELSLHLSIPSHIDTVEWLDAFIAFLSDEGYDNQLNLKNSPILPNQNGFFSIKDDLFLDNGQIDETLKDIAASLGYDCREELLDKGIYLVLPENRVRTQDFIAEEIAKLIKPRFAELPRSQETKQIFKELYLWFNKNNQSAESIFEELLKNKHKLYDDDEIAENMQKAKVLDEILLEQGITLDKLKELAENGKLKNILNENTTTKSKVDLSVQDALTSLGITTIEELEKALNDRIVYENFGHISEASCEMLEYVLSLIKRAKENVKHHLDNLPEYDITNWREIATTVVSGVRKNGNTINVVIRPSDGGQVIFYYSSEKDALEQSNAELWIDDDAKEPQHLTLGRILKRNKIDRISV